MKEIPLELQITGLTIAAALIGWFAKTLLKVLTDIRDKLEQMNINFVKQESKIVEHDLKLEDHEQRLRVVEKHN